MGRLTHRPSDKQDLVRYVIQDYEYSRDSRRAKEALWANYWRVYLSERRYEAPANRNNVVSPWGGSIVRILVPLIKRTILSTYPYIRALPRKRELRNIAKLITQQMAWWLDQVDAKTIVLTHMLKESLIFGNSWGIISFDVEWQDFGKERVPIKAMPRIIPVPVEFAYPYPLARNWDDLRREGYFVRQIFKTLKELEDDPLYDQEAVSRIGADAALQHRGVFPIDRIFADQRRRVLGLSQAEWERNQTILRERGDEPVELLEMTASGTVVTIANRALVVREESLDHPFPVFALTPDPAPGEVFGKSIYHDIHSSLEQRDYVLNNVYDNLGNQVHGKFVGMHNMYDEDAFYNMGAGDICEVRRPDAIQPLVQQDTIRAAMPWLTQIDRDLGMGSGVNEVLSNIGAGAGTVYPETATVGNIKQSNAMMFVAEMVSQIEQVGLKRMAEIFWDMAQEISQGMDFWLRLAGEEGAEFRNVNPDTLAAGIDFEVIGAAFSERKMAESQTANLTFDRMMALHTSSPGLVNLMELGRSYLEAMDFKERDRVLPGTSPDQGPDIEHQVMMQGLPVEPEEFEDIATHLEVHVAALQQELQNESADPMFIQLLLDHVRKTQKMAQVLGQRAMASMGGPGQNPAAALQSVQPDQGGAPPAGSNGEG